MPTLLLSIFSLFYLPSSSVSLSYFIHAVLVHRRKHSCVWFTFSIATLNGTSFRRNCPRLWPSFSSKQLSSTHFFLVYNDIHCRAPFKVCLTISCFIYVTLQKTVTGSGTSSLSFPFKFSRHTPDFGSSRFEFCSAHSWLCPASLWLAPPTW